MNQGPAGAEVEIQVLRAQIAGDRHREVGLDPAVSGLGFDVGGIVRRCCEGDGAVMRADFELAAFPRSAGEVGLNCAVDGGSTDIAGDAFEAHRAIVDIEAQVAADVGNGDCAVTGLHGQIAGLWDEDFIADAPRGVLAASGAIGMHLAAGTVDGDLAGHNGGGCLAISR